MAAPYRRDDFRGSGATGRMGCLPRTVDNWSKQGIIREVKLPGRKRGCGIVFIDIDRFLVTKCG
jgi:hypothetical protein